MESLPHYPATTRNRQPIFEVMSSQLPDQLRILELASGTGEHCAWICQQKQEWTWQPSDADPNMLPVIDAYSAASDNALRAIHLDVTSDWSTQETLHSVMPISVLLCINMIHIAPWEATIGLLLGAERLLTRDNHLMLYGPYKQGGQHTAPSNQRFDLGLQARDPKWGVRNLEDVVKLARKSSLSLELVQTMPANNLSLIFRRI